MLQGEQANLEIAALHEIGKLLGLSTDLNVALTSSLNILRSFLGMRNGTVALFDPVTADLFLEAAPEMSDADRIRGRCRPGEGIAGRIFTTGLPTVIPDVAAEPLFASQTAPGASPDEGGKAFLGVPIRDGRVTLGVLTAERLWREGPISFHRDTRVLTMVANMIAARVRLHQLENPRQIATAEACVPSSKGPLKFVGVVGRSAAMRDLLDMVERIAPSRATVLLRGESGTGKDLVARVIHENSPRAGRPFVVLNCAALPETLLESELFGHERGAFTGAMQAKEGRFELANGGTLFLDEVGDTPPAAQVKLLRVLQERQFERLGGRRTITVDVRIVAATNRDLEEAVREGRFRFDLYHRLSVVSLFLPPLRDRREDIPPLAQDFLGRLGTENGKRLELSREALGVLLGCQWSGNVRQLKNCVERLVVTASHPVIAPEDFPCCRPSAQSPCLLETVHQPEEAMPARPATAEASTAEPAPPEDEHGRVVNALEKTGWVQAKAARLLGMTPRQLAYRVRKYGIELQRF